MHLNRFRQYEIYTRIRIAMWNSFDINLCNLERYKKKGLVEGTCPFLLYYILMFM